MKKSLAKAGALSISALLALGGCGAPPKAGNADSSAKPAQSQSESKQSEEAKSGDAASGAASDVKIPADFKACMVSDAGGFDDKSFNETSYKGLVDAVKKFGIKQGQIESNAGTDYSRNIQSQIDAKCNIIVTVGFLLADATAAAAEKNPNVEFAIVDSVPKKQLKNYKGITFDSAQPAFLAGYAAAAMTKTGTVGTFGGMNIPTVTIFMSGFAQGVEYYNKENNKQIKVLGWGKDANDRQFVGGGDPFGDAPAGKQTAATLVAAGADIILPVAGPTGIGALQLAKESNGKVSIVWVDTDGYISAPEYKNVILTSVQKAMDIAVAQVIEDAGSGKFSSEQYVGTLKNGGVKLAPFHDFESKMPAGLADKLEAIKADIISGKIKVEIPK